MTKIIESFDNGAGIFTNQWGAGTDSSVDGQITVWTTPDDKDSGMMINPDNYGTPEGGYGYGQYSFTMETSGVIGVYALTWPATDVWPGPEVDFLEILADGTPYSAVHYKDSNGGNGFNSFTMEDVDVTEVHTYTVDWQPGSMTMYVDGEQQWHTTDHVPVAAEDGGENAAPGIGTQTWWNDGELTPGNHLTLYEFSYVSADEAEPIGDGVKVESEAAERPPQSEVGEDGVVSTPKEDKNEAVDNSDEDEVVVPEPDSVIEGDGVITTVDAGGGDEVVFNHPVFESFGVGDAVLETFQTDLNALVDSLTDYNAGALDCVLA